MVEGVEIIKEVRGKKFVLVVSLENGMTFSLDAQTLSDTEKLAQFPALKKRVYDLKKALEELKTPLLAPLPLVNNWVNKDGAYAKASYCIRNGVCFLEGSVKNGGFEDIAQLPEGARLGERLVFDCNTHKTSSRVDVLPDGKVRWMAF